MLQPPSYLRVSTLCHTSLALAAWLLCAPSPAAAHPLQAEPINHPYVFTFDQFHIAEDPDETIVNGGLLLMAETNCIACHAAPQEWQGTLAPRPGPNLAGVGSRLDAGTLWLMVRSPQHRKKGTLMPGMFNGAEEDPEKVEALTQYLTTLKQPVEPMPAGDADRGKKLYHTVGCVACHEPALDYRPPTAAPGANVDRPGNGSNPLALADAYDVNALGRLLLNPHDFRPAGRMPSMHLSEQEAADIAAYLHIGRTAEKAVERAALKIAPQTAATGRALFVEQRCSVCHSTGETLDKHAARPLNELHGDSQAACIAETPVAGTPRFDFNPLQRRALRLALAKVQHHAPEPMTAHQKIDWQMLRLNCYACHDRDGKGGPEDARAQYYMAADSGAESLGDFGRLPPNLDKAGWKLTPTWLQRVLYGESGGSVRPYLSVRMPNFGKANTEMLPALFAEADKPANPPAMDTSGLAKHHRSEGGRKLMGITGLGCVTCHGLKDRKSLGVPVINLSHTVERLNPSYFKALLLNPQVTQPGTLMPPLFMTRKTASQDIEQIWTYLKELDQQPLPEGLLRNDDYELKPEKEGRPIVFRTFMEGVGTHAIAIGYPEGRHAAFDALRSRWAVLWKGRFVDALGTWQDRSMPPAKPLGDGLLTLGTEPSLRKDGAAAPEFQGYRFDKQGCPTLLYRVEGITVEDRLQPAANGFEHTLTAHGQGLEAWTFHGLAKEAQPVKLAPDASGTAVVHETVTW